MSIDPNLVGMKFVSTQFSIGSNSGTDPITYTETDMGSELGANTVITIDAVTTTGGVTTITATISGSTVLGGVANGMVSGTVIANNTSSIVATGMVAGMNGTIYLTNNSADQPGVNNSTMVPAASDNDAYVAPCYASGTLIRTVRGDVLVEALVPGDLVVTASGAHRAIRWLGHRTVDCNAHPRPHQVMPVRIAAHAFGPDRPSRPLYVSPGHAICVDLLGEVLVPAVALVNDETITQVGVDEITYWHVELDSHDILLAENLPAESYLDMGNRTFFREADVVALGASPDAAARSHADFCRPFVDRGPLLESIRAQLEVRASAIGSMAAPVLQRSAA